MSDLNIEKPAPQEHNKRQRLIRLGLLGLAGAGLIALAACAPGVDLTQIPAQATSLIHNATQTIAHVPTAINGALTHIVNFTNTSGVADNVRPDILSKYANALCNAPATDMPVAISNLTANAAGNITSQIQSVHLVPLPQCHDAVINIHQFNPAKPDFGGQALEVFQKAFGTGGLLNGGPVGFTEATTHTSYIGGNNPVGTFAELCNNVTTKINSSLQLTTDLFCNYLGLVMEKAHQGVVDCTNAVKSATSQPLFLPGSTDQIGLVDGSTFSKFANNVCDATFNIP